MPTLTLAGNFRADLQEAYTNYLENPLHYKVFALKNQDDRWDGWYSWGYDDLDLAITDALAKCNRGIHVLGECHVYALGNSVVAGFGPKRFAQKVADYRLEGLRLRRYPAPLGKNMAGAQFTADGRYLGALWAGSKENRLFLYDADERIWKFSAPVHTGFTPRFRRNLALGSSGRYFAFTEYVQKTGEKGRSFIHFRDWQKKEKWDVELTKGSFWNDACGLAFSPDHKRLAVCMDGGVDTRIQWFDAHNGKEVLRVTSKGLNGRFDHSLLYSPGGKYLLVRGARYQFDWVLKKKGKEADLAWIFDSRLGKLVRTFEFPVGPGRKGPNDIRFAGDDKLLVSEDTMIALYSIKSGVMTKQFPYTFKESGVAVLSPFGVLAVVDGGQLQRFRYDGSEFLPVDSPQKLGAVAAILFDGSVNRWLLAGQEMNEIPVLDSQDLAMLDLYHEADKLFAKGEFDRGMAKLDEAINMGPYLPLGKDEIEFYFRYPALPLASFGKLLAKHARVILEQSPMISRIGLELLKDEKSDMVLTTVAKVDTQGAAFLGGLQGGDVILALDGQPVKRGDQINDYIAGLPIGSTVVLRLKRGKGIVTRTLVTENGFQDPGQAAHLLLDLFDYGQLAIEAGQPGLASLAATKLRAIAAGFPSSFPVELISKVAASLDALIMAYEGDVAGGYKILRQQASPHPFKFRLYNTRVWWPFYADRQGMAKIIGISEQKLPHPVKGEKHFSHQAFPDLQGRIIPAVTIPALRL